MTVNILIWKIAILAASVGGLWIISRTAITLYKIKLENDAKMAEKLGHLKK